MKKCNRLISLILVLTMAFVMAGCGNSAAENGEADSTETTGETNAETGTTQTDDSGAENADAASGGTFIIGGIGPITGNYAEYGLGVKNATQLAIDEINAAGGVNGYQLALEFQDDETDPEKGVNAYNALKDKGVQMLLGCVTSDSCIAVTNETQKDNMFQLTPSGSAVACTQYDNCFRVCFSDPAQGAASALYIGENNLASKVAVIYDSSNTYSSGIYESFVSGAEAQSFEIVSAEAFTAESNTDFSVQLQKAKDAGADLVFLPIYYNEAALILRQAADMDYKPIFFGVDGMDGILTGVENFDTSLAEGVMLLTPFAADATDDLTVQFVTAYKEKFGGDVPNQFAADAYDGVYALKAAIEKSGVKPTDSVSDICEGLKGAFTEISIDGLTGSGIVWDASGEPNKEPKAVKIVNGAYEMQ